MSSTRDIRIPADSVLALRRSLVREVGADAAGQALREAGYAAGDVLFDRLARGDDALAETPSTSFWERLAALFRELGWGTVRHEELHPGVGALVARDWFEADPANARASCPFTTGVLANLLGRVAGGEVAVLQVECEPSAPACSRFLFGAAEVLDGLYAGLREGRDLQTSLAGLG